MLICELFDYFQLSFESFMIASAYCLSTGTKKALTFVADQLGVIFSLLSLKLLGADGHRLLACHFLLLAAFVRFPKRIQVFEEDLLAPADKIVFLA